MCIPCDKTFYIWYRNFCPCGLELLLKNSYIGLLPGERRCLLISLIVDLVHFRWPSEKKKTRLQEKLWRFERNIVNNAKTLWIHVCVEKKQWMYQVNRRDIVVVMYHHNIETLNLSNLTNGKLRKMCVTCWQVTRTDCSALTDPVPCRTCFSPTIQFSTRFALISTSCFTSQGGGWQFYLRPIYLWVIMTSKFHAVG